MIENPNQNEQWKLLVFLLDEIRQKNNLSITETAMRAGISQGHVSRFFSCKFEPKLSSFLKISNAVKAKLKIENEKI